MCFFFRTGQQEGSSCQNDNLVGLHCHDRRLRKKHPLPLSPHSRAPTKHRYRYTVTMPRIPYRTIPYRIVMYRTTVPDRTVPCRTVPYCNVPYHTIPYRTLPIHRHNAPHIAPHACPLAPHPSLHGLLEKFIEPVAVLFQKRRLLPRSTIIPVHPPLVYLPPPSPPASPSHWLHRLLLRHGAGGRVRACPREVLSSGVRATVVPPPRLEELQVFCRHPPLVMPPTGPGGRGGGGEGKWWEGGSKMSHALDVMFNH